MPYVTLETGKYLLDALWVVGPVSISPMGGQVPITWLDLWAYGQATKAVSEPWEYEALQAMSRAYLEGYEHGKSHFALPPLEVEDDG